MTSDAATGDSVVIDHERLAGFIAEIFRHTVCSDAEAKRIGRSLVGANLAGHDSHGVIRSALYVDLLANGVQLADQEIKVLIDSGALMAGGRSIRHEPDRRACRGGIGHRAMQGIGHCGRGAAQCRAPRPHRRVRRDSRCGGPCLGALRECRQQPAGGPDRCEDPAHGHQPVRLWSASGGPTPCHPRLRHVCRGRRQGHGGAPWRPASTGQRAGVCRGEITGDPRVLYTFADGQRPNSMDGPGALRAMGEHKGSGISVMCELLAGALTGTGTAGPRRVRFANGMMSVYVDPAQIDAAIGETDDGYNGIAADYLDWFYEAAAIDPDQPVKLPGDVEHERRQYRMAKGITLPAETWESICDGARAAGLPEATINAAVAG